MRTKKTYGKTVKTSSAKREYNLKIDTDVEVYKLVLDGSLPKFPNHFWKNPGITQTCREITRYLLEERLGWDEEGIKNNLSQKTFIDNKLNGMLQKVFDSSPFLALDNAYPGRFKEWELKNTPVSFWTKENCYKAVEWLIEEKLKLSKEQIKEQYSKEFLIKHGLSTVISVLKGQSPYDIINKLYPGQFKPWEFVQTPIGYWNGKTIAEAFKWFVEEKMRWNEEDIKNRLTVDILETNGLSGLAAYMTKQNIGLFDLVDMAYPGRFNEWDLLRVNKWTKEKAIQATRWLVEERLQWNTEKARGETRREHFDNNGLRGMLDSFYKGSPYLALKDAYPKENWNKLKSQFKNK
jgi:hypothetical protein